ncbi:MAG: DNA polymerase III subunit gamma/tau [Lachnospiraceae bacterium]|nr:DNA polymerase III subunit gamma/tau [Lachnospiraceae bacterium]
MLYVDERPQTFDEVKEQEFIIKNLQSQAKKGVFFNSIILCGKYGTGKTTVARIIARAANCENRDENGNPCMECASCRSILDRSGTDVIEIDGASNNGVDAARKLMKEINYIPMSRYRVIIIDECHRISSPAWDALLKTLEEPPEHVMFILCTTDETALPETIRSRAPIYRFESISAGMLGRHAKETARKYDIKISDIALNLLASYADGSMRNVLSLLEQMSMQSKDITEDDVEMLLGINHYTFTVEFISGMLSGNLTVCMEQLNTLVSEGRSVRLFAKDLMRTAVDMVLQKTGITPDNGNMEYLKLLGAEAAKHSMAQLNSLAEETAGLEKRMRKESDTYVMYGGIISAVRKLHKDVLCTDAEGSTAILQSKETVKTEQKELPAETVPDMIPMPVTRLNNNGLSQDENKPAIPADDGINRNVCVLPDLEQALMDFMPDLKREPRGRFDAGTDNTGYAEDNVISDDTDCMETDAGLYDIPGQYDDYSQTVNGNGFMLARGMEYTEVSSIEDDAYDDETDSQEYDGDSCSADDAGDSTELTGDNDDFDRRWEEARQNGTESNGFPLSPLNDQASAKRFNIFGLPFGFGIPNMGRKQSFT